MTARIKNSTNTSSNDVTIPHRLKYHVNTFASSLISSTQLKLLTLQDTLGVSHDDRSSHLNEWMTSKCMFGKIATEEALVEPFRREGDEMKNTYKSCYKAFGLCNHHGEIGSIRGRMMRHEM